MFKVQHTYLTLANHKNDTKMLTKAASADIALKKASAFFPTGRPSEKL